MMEASTYHLVLARGPRVRLLPGVDGKFFLGNQEIFLSSRFLLSKKDRGQRSSKTYLTTTPLQLNSHEDCQYH